MSKKKDHQSGDKYISHRDSMFDPRLLNETIEAGVDVRASLLDDIDIQSGARNCWLDANDKFFNSDGITFPRLSKDAIEPVIAGVQAPLDHTLQAADILSVTGDNCLLGAGDQFITDIKFDHRYLNEAKEPWLTDAQPSFEGTLKIADGLSATVANSLFDAGGEFIQDSMHDQPFLDGIIAPDLTDAQISLDGTLKTADKLSAIVDNSLFGVDEEFILNNMHDQRFLDGAIAPELTGSQIPFDGTLKIADRLSPTVENSLFRAGDEFIHDSMYEQRFLNRDGDLTRIGTEDLNPSQVSALGMHDFYEAPGQVKLSAANQSLFLKGEVWGTCANYENGQLSGWPVETDDYEEKINNTIGEALDHFQNSINIDRENIDIKSFYKTLQKSSMGGVSNVAVVNIIVVKGGVSNNKIQINNYS